MAYIFDKVRLLTYSHTPIDFENGTRYKVEKKFSIQGTFFYKTNESGVEQTWSGAEALLQSASFDYDDIILNGINFGLGKISNISFEEGNHVTRQDYTFDVECYDQVDLVEDGLIPTISAATAVLIDKIDESISYEIDNDNNQSYTQSASVRLNQKAMGGADAGDAMASAENLINLLFSSTSNFISQIQGDYGSLNNDASLVTRTYSMVDAVCSFSRKLSIPTGGNSGYSLSRTYDLKYNDVGTGSITEKVSVKGSTPYPYSQASSAFQASFQNADAYSRCSQIYADYPKFAANLILFNQSIEKSSTTDPYKGTYEYSITFTNDPKYVDKVAFSFSDEISYNENGDAEITEQGQIIGLGNSHVVAATMNIRYNHALDYYNAHIKNKTLEVEPRINTYFNSIRNPSGSATQVAMTRRTVSFSQLEGSIQYSFTYSDVSDFINNVKDTIRKVEIDSATNMPVHLTQSYNIFNGTNQIVQPQNTSTVGLRTVSVKLKGTKKTLISDFLSHAQDYAKTFAPNSTTIAGLDSFYIKAANYSYTPNSNEFQLSVTWNFFGPNYAFTNTNLS